MDLFIIHFLFIYSFLVGPIERLGTI